MDVEMKQLIKSLPERKRRTFLRYMKGKKKQKNTEDGEEGEEGEPEVREPRKTREELLNKIRMLEGTDEEFYDGVTEGDDDEDGSWCSDDFSSGEEE